MSGVAFEPSARLCGVAVVLGAESSTCRRAQHREPGDGASEETGVKTSEQCMSEPWWTIRAATSDDGLGALVGRDTISATSGSAGRGGSQGANTRAQGEMGAGHRVCFGTSGDFFACTLHPTNSLC